MDFMEINEAINGFVWGPVMLAVLVGTGVYLTIRSGFFQVTKFVYAMRNTIGKVIGRRAKAADDTNISGFQAVSTALASTVGTGNVVGVATAITIGGPGAVFWMWVSASSSPSSTARRTPKADTSAGPCTTSRTASSGRGSPISSRSSRRWPRSASAT